MGAWALRLGVVLVGLWLGGCAGPGVRCDTRLRPINSPASAAPRASAAPTQALRGTYP